MTAMGHIPCNTKGTYPSQEVEDDSDGAYTL